MSDLVGQKFGSDGVEQSSAGLVLRVDEARYDAETQTASMGFGSPVAKFNAISGNTHSEIILVKSGYVVNPDTCPEVDAPISDVTRNNTANIILTQKIDIGVAGVSPALSAEIEAAKCLKVEDDFAKALLLR